MSTDPALLWGSGPSPARVPRPGEPLWTLCKNGHQTNAELRGHGDYGWEIQILRDGELLYGQRFDLRAQAIAYGDALRKDFSRKGWR